MSRALEVDTDEKAVELCRQDDVLRRLQDQTRELEHYRRRVAELERGIQGLAQRVEGISGEASEALYAQILAKRI